jgi:sulfur-oxidizing protein SoxY
MKGRFAAVLSCEAAFVRNEPAFRAPRTLLYLRDNGALPLSELRRFAMPMATRRSVMALGAAAAAAVVLGRSVEPALAANDSADLIKAFTGGKTPVEGKVKLDLPEIAENGNTVPMTVSVDSPMTEQSYVAAVLVVGDGNPNAGMATFHFSPASGVAEANTRIRLATTQNVIAIAKMNDGSVFTASKPVKVTIGGCGG